MIDFIFIAALFLNALLFIPQAIRIFKQKHAQNVSVITFLGFLLIQLAIILHALIVRDTILLIGYVLSFITCGSVVTLILFFRKQDTLNNHISLEEIIAQLPGHIYWKDRVGVYLGCNTRNWEDIGLRSLSDLTGKTDYDVISKKDADQVRIIDEEVIRENKEKIIEEKVNMPDGNRIIYLSHKLPLKNKLGEIIGVLGYSIDITDTKRNTLDQLETLENIIAVMPGNVYWMDRNGVYLGCNDNEAQSVGLKSRKEIVGKRNLDIPGFVIPSALDPINQEVIEQGKTITIEEPALLRDGTHAIFLSHKVPMRNSEGEIVGMIGVSIDITERKKLEEDLKLALQRSEQANQLKTDFIRNIHHDLRTPTSGIYSMTQLLSESEDLSMIQTCLKEVSEAAGELLNYCNSILDFSTIELGHRAVIEKKFNLKQLMEQVITLEKPAIHQKGLAFTFDYDEQIPEQLMGDEQRLYRILMNLMGNAIKFTERGSITLQASVMTRSYKAIVLSIRIKDTGIGIPKDKQTLIYEKLTRLNPSNRGQYKGLGLGLTIVKQFTMEMEGEIEVDSELNRGTQFTCILPFTIPLALRNDE